MSPEGSASAKGKTRSFGVLLATAVSLVGAVAAAAALIIQNFFTPRFTRFPGNLNGTRAFNATRTFAGSRFAGAGAFGFVGPLATTAYICVIVVAVILVAVVCSEKFGSKPTSS